jgi:Ca2+-binding EF-hand superfamily protein
LDSNKDKQIDRQEYDEAIKKQMFKRKFKNSGPTTTNKLKGIMEEVETRANTFAKEYLGEWAKTLEKCFKTGGHGCHERRGVKRPSDRSSAPISRLSTSEEYASTGNDTLDEFASMRQWGYVELQAETSMQLRMLFDILDADNSGHLTHDDFIDPSAPWCQLAHGNQAWTQLMNTLNQEHEIHRDEFINHFAQVGMDRRRSCVMCYVSCSCAMYFYPSILHSVILHSFVPSFLRSCRSRTFSLVHSLTQLGLQTPVTIPGGTNWNLAEWCSNITIKVNELARNGFSQLHGIRQLQLARNQAGQALIDTTPIQVCKLRFSDQVLRLAASQFDRLDTDGNGAIEKHELPKGTACIAVLISVSLHSGS